MTIRRKVIKFPKKILKANSTVSIPRCSVIENWQIKTFLI